MMESSSSTSSSSSSSSVTSSSSSSTPYYSYLEVFLGEKYRHINVIRPPMTSSSSSSSSSSIHSDDDDSILSSSSSSFDLPPWLYVDPIRVNRFLTEGCLVRSVVMGFGGGLLGILFGGFFFTMKPMDTVDTSLPYRKQIRESFRGCGKEIAASAKNFAKIGFVYSLVECVIERERACHDVMNAVYAGCISGAAFSWRGGLLGATGGCAMFAAFSGVMEKFQIFSGYDDEA